MTDRFRLLRLITGHWIAQTVRAVAELSIAEHLAAGPRHAEDIALAERSDRDVTLRLLRSCVGIELVTALPDGRFAATPLLRLLRADAPDSLRDTALTMAAPAHWPVWADFPAVEADIFADAFDDAELAALIDIGGAGVVADLGGGDGGLLHALLHRDPALRGVVLELPHAVGGAVARTRRQGLAERCEVRAGDFFADIPSADLYLLKLVLRDWNDDLCVRLLRACRRAMGAAARLVVLDFVPDIVPLAGIERDLAEFDELFAAARLSRRGLVTTRGGLCVLEVVPT